MTFLYLSMVDYFILFIIIVHPQFKLNALTKLTKCGMVFSSKIFIMLMFVRVVHHFKHCIAFGKFELHTEVTSNKKTHVKLVN